MSKVEVADLSGLPKVKAWDANDEDFVVGVLIRIRDKGPLKYVVLGGNSGAMGSFGNCEPYTPPKTRPMTREDVLGLVCNKLSVGYVVRYAGNSWNPCGSYKFGAEVIDKYEYATISPEGVIGDPQKFEVEV